MQAREQAWMAKIPPFPWGEVEKLKKLRRDRYGGD